MTHCVGIRMFLPVGASRNPVAWHVTVGGLFTVQNHAWANPSLYPTASRDTVFRRRRFAAAHLGVGRSGIALYLPKNNKGDIQ